jgi:hypothetical protein
MKIKVTICQWKQLYTVLGQIGRILSYTIPGEATDVWLGVMIVYSLASQLLNWVWNHAADVRLALSDCV